MATGAPAATEPLGVWDGSRRGSKSAADDEAAGDLLLKLQEGGAKVVAINRMADPVLRKAAASQQLREKLEANAAKAVDLFKAWDTNGDGKVRCRAIRRNSAQLSERLRLLYR